MKSSKIVCHRPRFLSVFVLNKDNTKTFLCRCETYLIGVTVAMGAGGWDMITAVVRYKNTSTGNWQRCNFQTGLSFLSKQDSGG